MAVFEVAPFLPSLLKKPEGPHTTVMIAAGQPRIRTLDDHKHKNKIFSQKSYGGTAPNIALFTNDGDRIGTSKGKRNIGDGNVMSVDVMHWNGQSGNPGAAYMTVSAATSGDAICISHMSVLDPTDGEGVGDFRFVPGEIAATCNNTTGTDYSWYYSDAPMEIDKGDDKYYRYPACLMIDRDAYVGPKPEFQKAAVKWEGFQIHLMDFTKDNKFFDSWNNDAGQMCNSPSRFHMYEKLNELQCPNIFVSTDTPAGALLPLKETAACEPSVLFPDPYQDPPCNNATLDLDVCPYGAERLYELTGELDPVKADKQDKAANLDNTVWARSPEAAAPADELTSSEKDPAESDDDDNPTRDLTAEDDDADAEIIPRHLPFHHQLVRSSIDDHSALRLCSDKHTIGPDFFSELEQLLCQTSTHTIFPVCTPERTKDCFDVETELLVYDRDPVKLARRGLTDVPLRDDGYAEVKRWARQV
ncbi:MAG: hypothetical protein Q9227_003177 [Pyrenula ochraceoflavens]